MAKKKRTGLLLVGGALATAAVGAIVFVARKASGKSPADKYDPYKRGGLDRPKTFKPASPKGGGKIWMNPKDYPPGKKKPAPPADWDFGGNRIWISPDCNYVVEGNRFMPLDDFDINAESPTKAGATLDEALDLYGGDNSVWGYVDYLVEGNDEAGIKGIYNDPVHVAWHILRDAAPACNEIDAEKYWGDGLYFWFQSLLERLKGEFPERYGWDPNFDPTQGVTLEIVQEDKHGVVGFDEDMGVVVVVRREGMKFYWATAQLTPAGAQQLMLDADLQLIAMGSEWGKAYIAAICKADPASNIFVDTVCGPQPYFTLADAFEAGRQAISKVI